MVYLKKIRCSIEKLSRGMFLLPLLFLGGCSANIDASTITQLLLAKEENCWPCTMYKVVWEAIGSLVSKMYDHLCNDALGLLGVGLLFWICFTVGKLVASIKEPNLKDFISNMAVVLFKAMVVALFLSLPSYTLYLLDLVVRNVLEAFMDLTLNIMFANSTIAKSLATGHVYEGDIVSAVSGAGNVLFTADIGHQIQDLIYRIYVGFHGGMSLGVNLIFQTDPSLVATGLFVTAIFFYLMLVIPLLFIEAFALLGAVIVFFPLALVLYVFPSTKAYVIPMWKVLFVSMAQILVTGVYMAVMIHVVQVFSDNILSPSRILSDPLLLMNLKNMKDQFLAFCALAYIMYRMSRDIPNISSRLLGDFNRSMMLAGITRAINIGKNVGLALGGAALAGTGVASGVGATMMMSAGKGMMETTRNPAGDTSSGGLSTAEQAQQQGAAKPK